MATYRIAVIAGDGIGKEVIPAGMAAIDAAVRGSDVTLSFTEFPWGCEFYLARHRMLDEDAFEQLAKFDAIYLGAIGAPTVPDHISAGDMILPLRKVFEQPEAFEHIFVPLANRVGVPLAQGLTVGHGPHYAPLPLGATYELSPQGKLRLVGWDWLAQSRLA